MTETQKTENERKPESHGCCCGSGKPKKVEVKPEPKPSCCMSKKEERVTE